MCVRSSLCVCLDNVDIVNVVETLQLKMTEWVEWDFFVSVKAHFEPLLLMCQLILMLANPK